MNGLAIGVIIFLILMTLAGMFMGFVRCIFGIAAFAISSVISFFITRLVGIALKQGSMQQAVCFLAVFVIAYIAVIVVAVSLDILSHLPVLSSLNRIGGAVLGAGLGLLCVWIAMAVVSVLADNKAAEQIAGMIEESQFLTGLYENNFIDMLLRDKLWSKIDLKK